MSDTVWLTPEPAGTRIKLKARRRCTTCPKVLVGRGPAQCSKCREQAAVAALAGKRLCKDCGNPVRGLKRRCAPCWRLHAAEIKAAYAANNRDKVRRQNREYYARLRASGWKDPTLKARLKKLRDKTRKHVYAPRRSRAVMRALRAKEQADGQESQPIRDGMRTVQRQAHV